MSRKGRGGCSTLKFCPVHDDIALCYRKGMKKKRNLPQDTAQRTKAGFDLAIGEMESDPPKDPRAQAAGREGGANGRWSAAI